MSDTNQNTSSIKGVIYILTNPSFPEYVKIGYANNVERRLSELNRSECTPFAFRVYATYEVDSRLSDMKIHSIIDKLNPDLRSIDNYNGKKRVREFYAMSAEDAYSILEAIAEIHNFTNRLKKWGMSEEDIEAESTAEEVKMNNQYDYNNVQENDYELKFQELYQLLDDYLKDKNYRGILKYDGTFNDEGKLRFTTNHMRNIFNKYVTDQYAAYCVFEIRQKIVSLQMCFGYGDKTHREDIYKQAVEYTQNIGVKAIKDNSRFAGYFPYVVRIKRENLNKEYLYKVLDETLLPILENEKKVYTNL